MAAVLLGSSGPVFSAEAEQPQQQPVGKPRFQFELGLSTHQESYEEFQSDGSRFMREDATMLGLKAGFRLGVGQQQHGAFKVEAEYAYGESSYTGAYQGEEYGSLRSDGQSRELLEVTALYQQHMPVPENWLNRFSVTMGLGMRELVDNLQESGDGGYKRTNTRIYALAGLAYDFSVVGWTLTPALTYKLSLFSQNVSELPLQGGGTYDLTHEQQGHGSEISVTLAQDRPRKAIVIRPFWRVWKMDDSNVVCVGADCFIEPRNTTNEVGLDVSMRF